MPLLVYCVCEAVAAVAPPTAGVRGAAVQEAVADGLRCFYSEISDLGGDAAATQKDALDFYAVTRFIFQRAAIVVFRFPNLMPDVQELVTYLERRAKVYQAALQYVRDAVQMEVRLTLAEPVRDPRGETSGKRYLQVHAEKQRKLADAASVCREALDEVARQYGLWWRSRPSEGAVRCFAMVPRSTVANVEQRLRDLHLNGVNAIVSGPWPVTEFLEFPND